MSEAAEGEFDLASLNDQELTEQVHDDLYNGLKDEVVEATHILLKRNWSAERVLNDALVEGMRIVGIDFRDGILFVPEVLLAANAMKAGMEILRPLLILGSTIRSRNTSMRSRSTSQTFSACPHF